MSGRSLPTRYISSATPVSDWLVEGYKKELERDELVLAALKCAKAIGFTGEK